MREQLREERFQQTINDCRGSFSARHQRKNAAVRGYPVASCKIWAKKPSAKLRASSDAGRHPGYQRAESAETGSSLTIPGEMRFADLAAHLFPAIVVLSLIHWGSAIGNPRAIARRSRPTEGSGTTNPRSRNARANSRARWIATGETERPQSGLRTHYRLAAKDSEISRAAVAASTSKPARIAWARGLSSFTSRV